jgi:hypothetical protein
MFLGSIFTRLLAPVRLLSLCRLRTNDYFVYSVSSLCLSGTALGVPLNNWGIPT